MATSHFPGGAGGGTIGGTISGTQVAVGASSDTLTGSANLTWDGANLAVGGSAALPATLTESGSDTNIPLWLMGKGSGPVVMSSVAASGVSADILSLIDNQGGAILTDGVGGAPAAQPVYYAAHADTGGYTGLWFVSSRGSIASPADSGNGDYAGAIQWAGWVNGSWATFAEQQGYFGPGTGMDSPGYLAFKTASPGALDSTTERFRLGWWYNSTSTMTLYTPALGNIATNAYSFWADETGVFRIRADNTFNAVYQAIPALYNPQVTKYTPGATDFERIIMGQWSSNIAQIGTEKGGTGTLRKVQLIGAGILTDATILPTTNPHVVGQLWSNSGVVTVSAG